MREPRRIIPAPAVGALYVPPEPTDGDRAEHDCVRDENPECRPTGKVSPERGMDGVESGTGTVLNELREIRVEETQARDGLGDAEISEGFEDWMGRLDDSGQFERVLRIFREGIDPDAAETRDERFEFGLDCVLDGVAARLGIASP